MRVRVAGRDSYGRLMKTIIALCLFMCACETTIVCPAGKQPALSPEARVDRFGNDRVVYVSTCVSQSDAGR